MKAGFRGFALGALALVATLGIAGEAAAGGKAKTTVGPFDMSYGNNVTNYEGLVSSPKTSCEKNRRVAVFRKKAGKDLKMGSDKASSKDNMSGGWVWFFQKPNYALPGTFYAKAEGTKKCKGGRSEDLQFNDCMPARRAGQCRAGGGDAKTRLTGSGTYDSFLDITFFSGNIASDRQKCEKDRKVVVFKESKGKDKKIGSGNSYEREDAPGKYGWTILSSENSTSKFYAKAPATNGCKAAKTKSFKIQQF